MARHEILIVDDEPDIRSLVSGILEDEGYGTHTACHGEEALEYIKKRVPHLVLLDVWLGDNQQDGLKILARLKQQYPDLPVVMMSGHGNIETAVAAIRDGAYDFIEKPLQVDRLLITIERVISYTSLLRQNEELKKRARVKAVLIGQTPAIAHMRQNIETAAPTSGRAFISGPFGSDKESIARTLHDRSKRSDAPFVVVRCADIHASDLDAALFGSEITISDEPYQNAAQQAGHRVGLVEKAHTGTLYLDDIHYLPLSIQHKLSRILQDQVIIRLGGTDRIPVDVRFMGSTSEDIHSMIQNQTFLDSLFYRLSVHHICVPALADRLIDLPLIAQHMMNEASETYGITSKTFTHDTLILMQSYSWPGDMQQLRHVIDWLILTHHSARNIESDMLPQEIINKNQFTVNWKEKSSEIIMRPLREAREMFEREYLLTQVNRFSGNISQTARFIGMERSALHRKLRTLGMTDLREEADA